MSYLIVNTTTANKKDAEILAKKIVSLNLGACVQISEVKSFYKWKGKTENTREFKLSIKTTKNIYKDLESFIIKNSKYELPEIVAIKINKGYKKYLNWLK